MKHSDQTLFEGIEQSTIILDGHHCTLPLFYTAGTATIGMFPANLSKLKHKSPDSRLQPAATMPGVGIVTVIAFEFETTIGPVNEVCVAVPLHTPGLPFGISMLQSLLRGYLPVWIWHLPVSTEIADIFGRATWGFPKILADIPITQHADGRRDCLLSQHGQPILALHSHALNGKRDLKVTLKNHLWQNGALQTADHIFAMHDIGFSITPGASRLELLSDHPIARDLDDVLLTKSSLISAFAPSLEAILHEPDRMSLSLARQLLSASPEFTNNTLEMGD